MKDSVNIQSTDGGLHYEITRELSEVVNRANLIDRFDDLNRQEEALLEQLEMVRKNKAVINSALETGSGTDKL